MGIPNLATAFVRSQLEPVVYGLLCFLPGFRTSLVGIRHRRRLGIVAIKKLEHIVLVVFFVGGNRIRDFSQIGVLFPATEGGLASFADHESEPVIHGVSHFMQDCHVEKVAGRRVNWSVRILRIVVVQRQSERLVACVGVEFFRFAIVRTAIHIHRLVEPAIGPACFLW